MAHLALDNLLGSLELVANAGVSSVVRPVTKLARVHLLRVSTLRPRRRRTLSTFASSSSTRLSARSDVSGTRVLALGRVDCGTGRGGRSGVGGSGSSGVRGVRVSRVKRRGLGSGTRACADLLALGRVDDGAGTGGRASCGVRMRVGRRGSSGVRSVRVGGVKRGGLSAAESSACAGVLALSSADCGAGGGRGSGVGRCGSVGPARTGTTRSGQLGARRASHKRSVRTCWVVLVEWRGRRKRAERPEMDRSLDVTRLKPHDRPGESVTSASQKSRKREHRPDLRQQGATSRSKQRARQSPTTSKTRPPCLRDLRQHPLLRTRLQSARANRRSSISSPPAAHRAEKSFRSTRRRRRGRSDGSAGRAGWQPAGGARRLLRIK